MSHRRRLVGFALVPILALTACTGAGGTAAPTGAATSASAAAAPSAGASEPAAGGSAAASEPAASADAGGGGTGSETVRVVLTGGPDAGTYTTTDDPLCTNGVIGEGGWGVQYSTGELEGEKDFTSFQLVYYPDGPPAGEAMFGDTPLLMTVTIGPLMGGRTYTVAEKTAESGEESEGEGEISVEDGDKPVITATGTTADGVEIEATVNCPSVTRL